MPTEAEPQALDPITTSPEAPDPGAGPSPGEALPAEPPPPPPYLGDGGCVAIGDMVVLQGIDGKKIMLRVEANKRRGSHNGEIQLDTLIGKPWGSAITSMKGEPMWMLRPTLDDWVMTLRRQTQIIYPKDLGPILMRLGISAGSTVIECGSGSGALTTALAWTVGASGRVFSYDRMPAHQARARENLLRAGLNDRVTWRLRDVEQEGFVDEGVDALFLDAKEVAFMVPHAARALAPGRMLGVLVPTFNQVAEVLRALQEGPWMDVTVEETFYRRYKTNPDRLRPDDRMVGHTGILVFARRIVPLEGVPGPLAAGDTEEDPPREP